MAFKLDKFKDSALRATQDSWLESAQSFGVPSLEYERVLEWAKSRINYDAPNGSLAYGIFEDDSDETVAIVDIVYSKQYTADLGWLKMLQISLSPRFAPSELERDDQKLSQVVDIYAQALIGTIDLTGTHTARVIKLYGRDNALLGWLRILNERFKSGLTEGWHSKMEGRWLVISVI